MKVKNIYLGCIDNDKIQKIVIIKKCNLGNRMMKFLLNSSDDEYKCVFTNKSFWFKMVDIHPIALFLKSEDMKVNISKKTLQKFYIEKEEELTKKLSKKIKHPVGFNLK